MRTPTTNTPLPSHIDHEPCVFPLLADADAYDACELDLRVHHDRRAYWIGLYRDNSPGAMDHGVEVLVAEGCGRDAARRRADDCHAAFEAFLDACDANHAALERLDIHWMACNRQRMLREHGFYDPFRLLKQRENEAALKLLPALLRQLDATPDPRRAVDAVRGVFAGNIFDVGAAATMAIVQSGKLDFHATLADLAPRPWRIDHLDAWVCRLTSGRPHRCAVMFVDNAGCDIVLGMVPFARDLLRRGMEVILTANTYPALNDVTAEELTALIDRIAALDPTLAEARDTGRLTVLPNGNSSSLIDLSELSAEFCDAVAGRGVDLVVLEGMGRAIESNFNARFTCDALKLAMVKDPDVAEGLGAQMYDLVCRFEASGD